MPAHARPEPLMPPRRSPAAKSAQPARPCALIPPSASQLRACAHCPGCDTRWTGSCTGVSNAHMRALPELLHKMDYQLYRRFNCAHARTARVATQDGLAAVQASQLRACAHCPDCDARCTGCCTGVSNAHMRALPALGLRCALIRCTYRISALSSAMPAPPALRRAPAARRA